MGADEIMTLPLKGAFELLERQGLLSEAAVLRQPIQGARGFVRRVKKGMALEFLRNKDLLNRFIADYWPNGATEDGQRRMKRYEICYQEWKEQCDPVGPEVVDEEENDADRFVYESDLRDYLAKNLRIIESGMTLWSFPNGQSAVEFDLDDRRRIDILARDAHGVPVVIELKVDRGHERVIGQALFYRESVKLKLNVARARIVIVAREISQELRIASKGISDIDLHEYKLSMTLQKV